MVYGGKRGTDLVFIRQYPNNTELYWNASSIRQVLVRPKTRYIGYIVNKKTCQVTPGRFKVSGLFINELAGGAGVATTALGLFFSL